MLASFNTSLHAWMNKYEIETLEWNDQEKAEIKRKQYSVVDELPPVLQCFAVCTGDGRFNMNKKWMYVYDITGIGRHKNKQTNHRRTENAQSPSSKIIAFEWFLLIMNYQRQSIHPFLCTSTEWIMSACLWYFHYSCAGVRVRALDSLTSYLFIFMNMKQTKKQKKPVNLSQDLKWQHFADAKHRLRRATSVGVRVATLLCVFPSFLACHSFRMCINSSMFTFIPNPFCRRRISSWFSIWTGGEQKSFNHSRLPVFLCSCLCRMGAPDDFMYSKLSRALRVSIYRKIQTSLQAKRIYLWITPFHRYIL